MIAFMQINNWASSIKHLEINCLIIIFLDICCDLLSLETAFLSQCAPGVSIMKLSAVF